MKKFLYVAMLAVLPLTAMAQHEEDTETVSYTHLSTIWRMRPKLPL